MNNKSMKIIVRYIIRIIFIVFIVLAINYSLFLFIIRYSPMAKEPTTTVKIIAEELNGDNKQLTDKTTKVIQKNNLWVQLVNASGYVIYSYNEPDDIYNYYSINDIAKLSKSYLNDYPVYLWESGRNLVILGYPKNTISKYNWFIPTNVINNLPLTLVVIMLMNLIITIILSIILSRKLTKPLGNIIKAISSLKEEQEVKLKEKGIFKDLAENINETSEIIRDKNHKIKLRDTAVSNWLTGISHDIRTPLSMILGYSALMEGDATLSEEVHSQARIITENAVRLSDLITDLNLASSLQYQLIPLNLSLVKLSSIARKAVAKGVNSGILKNSSIDLIIQDESASALLDEALFLRAIINLIANSAKHNKQGCNITVTVPNTNEYDYVSIIVSDNGSGIPKDKIERINGYDYFNAWINKSNGLGLVIVKSIIETHHGQMVIESEKGKGTTIVIRIPAG
ncbi:Signal transduction histidine kinase [Clostridium amylolyticum]|uniref:histidine kinase n=1 Tax=Clostridium amylolyticum TaxID=1121298 RepID=A0A1M6NJD8_9CLOT|nr:HAMP domain-containing sensor histidine kinase [Clostridium amylolyticum]SHJ95793.1 Signal transduction histidine kinase [Clostridium amylolyticum]